MEVESIRVTKQDIENLSQLDRLEYKMELKELEGSNYIFDSVRWICWKLLLPTSIIALLVHYLFGGLQSHPELLNLFERLLKTFIIMIPVGLAFDLFALYTTSNEKRKLNLKFFKNKNK